ncbi:MAG TPA: DUF3198 domain-containing protein [Thermoplasmatales archaeon]|nr:DUF3198 domain-containing protein [Thermoplasmatales archaeon]
MLKHIREVRCLKIWREIRFPLSLLIFVLGIIFFISSIAWLFFRETNLSLISDLSRFFGDWNYYLIVVGIVLLFVGGWYSYDYIKKKRYLLEEIKTDRKSEFVKKKAELEAIVKSLPKKYERMLREKEEKLGLR